MGGSVNNRNRPRGPALLIEPLGRPTAIAKKTKQWRGEARRTRNARNDKSGERTCQRALRRTEEVESHLVIDGGAERRRVERRLRTAAGDEIQVVRDAHVLAA